MLYNYFRVFYSDNGTLTDYSLANQDSTLEVPAGLVAGEDFLYIAQEHPFNNLFVQLASTTSGNTTTIDANANTATISIEYWDGTTWRSCVDILDGTSLGGKTLAQDGVIQFCPHKDYNWNYIDDTSLDGSPSVLQSITLYNLYWLRIKSSATLSNTTSLRRILYAFTRHSQLSNLDCTIDDYLTSFASGKTSWDDEIITASIMLVLDLRAKGLIRFRGEILSFDDVTMAAAWRTLALIYGQLGSSFADKKAAAMKEYSDAINLRRFSLDMDANGRLDQAEMRNRVIMGVR